MSQAGAPDRFRKHYAPRWRRTASSIDKTSKEKRRRKEIAPPRSIAPGSRSEPNSGSRTALQKHVDFFDSDRDGRITIEETYAGLRRLGVGVLRSPQPLTAKRWYFVAATHDGLTCAATLGTATTGAVVTRSAASAMARTRVLLLELIGRHLPRRPRMSTRSVV